MMSSLIVRAQSPPPSLPAPSDRVGDFVCDARRADPVVDEARVREARAGETTRGEVLSQVFVRLPAAKHNPDPAHLIRPYVSIRPVEIRRPREPERYWPAALDRMF